jgi:hypothetical protein
MVPDRLDDIVGTGKNIIIPEAKNGIAVPVQEIGAAGIMCQPVALVVLATVNLDDQLSFETGKVNDVGAHTMLTAEMDTKSVAAKTAPQPFLRFRHIPS